MAVSRTIIIAGAGIGGLTASLTLARAGFRSMIIERESKLEETGAGLQISPNASRILIDLGLGPELAGRAIVPDTISIASTRANGDIATIPIREMAEKRYGAPYWVLRRADLQAVLLAKVIENPDIDLQLGCRFEDVATYPTGVTVAHRAGTSRRQETALALIGADGVWSSVRNELFPDRRPQFTGRIAWRGIVDSDQLPRGFATGRVQLWMGPNAHLVAYPMADGRRINIVAIVTGSWNRPGWSEPGDASEIGQHFTPPHWPIAPRMMIGAVESWRKWALFAMPDGGVWAKDKVALLGDAAHAMLPFVAQGAAMAIEDAAVLANCLQQQPGEIAAAFRHYEQLRKPRVSRVQRTARATGKIYHMAGAMAFARDQSIRLLGSRRLLSRNDWIYGWR
ncbi:MAG: FAD-dependent monooxygenase [Xanthobacteraceae bacterium]|nr:FAD-dependent monooxygenase [Xanthobacteraceae bacterium]